MSNPITITCAPCCWGVDDVRNPHLPPWERVLDEAAAAGFGGLELGPYGYMPLDAGRVGAALEARGLSIVAGTIFDDLVSPANRENLLRQTDEICALDHRPAQAAEPSRPALRGALPDGDGLGPRRARLCRRPFRPRAASRRRGLGGHGREHPRHRRAARATATASARSSTRTPAATSSSRTSSTASPPTCRPSSAGLCLDTGHLDYSGMDPVETIRRTPTAPTTSTSRTSTPPGTPMSWASRIRFFEACAEGVMCPIGRGGIDYAGLRALLERDRLRRLHHHRAGARPAQHRQHPRGPRGEPDFLRQTGF